MKHEGGKDAVECGAGIRQAVRKALIELDGNAGALGFASRTRQSRRIRIESHDFERRMQALQLDGKCARSAPNVEDAMCRAKSGLGDERRAKSAEAENFDERIVEWQGPILSGGRKEITRSALSWIVHESRIS